MIYFVQSAGTQMVKIGMVESDDYRAVLERVKDLQVGSGQELILLKAIKGGREEEAALHLRWYSRRVHGEWFKMTEEDISEIRLAGLTATTVPVPRLTTRAW